MNVSFYQQELIGDISKVLFTDKILTFSDIRDEGQSGPNG